MVVHSVRRVWPALALAVVLSMAAAASAQPARPGAAGDVCGGMMARPCGAGLFCKYEPRARCGIADQTGTCQSRPQVCTMQYAPVCGCDGRTHSNACAAAEAGTSVLSEGACAGSGGARCGMRGAGPCRSGYFCSFPAGANCGRTDAGGTCRQRPQACTMQYAPVCGCDGRTYSNACVASEAGVSVERQGACAGGAGAACGTRGAARCGAGLYCEFAAGCGRTDAGGRCASKPTRCTREYRPVCGCDGRTYSNRCGARAAGVSVQRDGACRPRPGRVGEACGRRGTAACSAGLYCRFEPSAICGRSDHGGTCRARTTRCTREFRPVCGCDGRTYSNACNAAARGVSVARNGDCRGRR